MARGLAVTKTTASAKRFYKSASVAPHEGRFAILLDLKPAKTAGRNVLSAPSERIAIEIAKEWQEQDEHLDRTSMPLSNMLAAAIDGGGNGSVESVDEVLKYLATDLICYRADTPEALKKRQALMWDPYIEFMQTEFGVQIRTTDSVTAIQQRDDTFNKIRSVLRGEIPEVQFAMRIATGIAGSAILALSLWKRAFNSNEIFEASRVDERYQEERWGIDNDAHEREEHLRQEFLVASKFMALLQ